MDWQVRGIRGAITVPHNTPEAIQTATLELVEAVCTANHLQPELIICAIFSVTPDLDAMFPAQAARSYPGWQYVPLLDVQQMQVAGGLEKCIRLLVQVNSCKSQREINHVYLRGASHLRPDLLIPES
ncbi:MAG: chorismate mutase [Pseudanabaenaceae cyanobacterium]